MIRSKAERSTMRSLTMGNALARHGSMVRKSPSLKKRMCNWHTVVPRRGPCGTPLIRKPHDPQMPSRQSCSNANGSSPRTVRSSLRTSSISRKDMSEETSLTRYSTNCPGELASCWRQILNVRFMLFVTPLRQVYVLKLERFLVQGRGLPMSPPLPGSDVGEIRVVPLGLALSGLALSAEVAAAGLRPVQGVATH